MDPVQQIGPPSTSDLEDCMKHWHNDILCLPLFLGIFGIFSLFVMEQSQERTTHTRQYEGYFGIGIPPSTAPGAA